MPNRGGIEGRILRAVGEAGPAGLHVRRIEDFLRKRSINYDCASAVEAFDRLSDGQILAQESRPREGLRIYHLGPIGKRQYKKLAPSGR